MPQELNVLHCHACKMFQVHLVKKAKKWQCKICGEKQTFKKIYFQGSGKNCRIQVQQLNTLNYSEDSDNLENIDFNNSKGHFFEDKCSKPFNVVTATDSNCTEYLKVCERERYFNCKAEIVQENENSFSTENKYICTCTSGEELAPVSIFSFANSPTKVLEQPNYKIEQECKRKRSIDDTDVNCYSMISPLRLSTKKRKLDVTMQSSSINILCNSPINICYDGDEMKNNCLLESSKDFELTSADARLFKNNGQCTSTSNKGSWLCQGLEEMKSETFDNKSNLFSKHYVNTDKLHFPRFDLDVDSSVEKRLNDSVVGNELKCESLKNEDTDDFVDKSRLKRDSIFESNSNDFLDFQF